MKSPNNKGTSASPTTKKPAAQSNGAADNKDAVALLKQDHRNVEALFKTYQTADQKEKQEIVQRICNELIVHTLLEEEIFYQACRDKGVEAKELDEAQIEHDSAKLLIGELLAGSPGSQYFDAKVTVLSEYIKHHVSEEEKPSEGIFAKAKKQGLDMSALGQRLQARKQELMEKAEANELGLPTPRALQLQSNQEYQENRNMPRYSNDRDRDERGRFTSEEEDDRRYSRSRSSSRYEEDDDRRGRGRGGFGESEGQSEAARSRRGSSRYEDDDRGGGRGRGGWFGDSEGHAEAARERWEDDDRGGRSGRSRSSSRYDEDDDSRGGRSGQSPSSRRDDEDEDRGGRGVRSRASSRDDDDDDRGGRGRSRGGWFGDPEGHAEAARQRWEDDDRGGRSSRSRSSARYEEDDRGGRGRSSSGGQSSGQGWYGDSEGHARAARRGWRDRD
jgi:hemerythrin superfamily protein